MFPPLDCTAQSPQMETAQKRLLTPAHALARMILLRMVMSLVMPHGRSLGISPLSLMLRVVLMLSTVFRSTIGSKGLMKVKAVWDTLKANNYSVHCGPSIRTFAVHRRNARLTPLRFATSLSTIRIFGPGNIRSH